VAGNGLFDFGGDGGRGYQRLAGVSERCGGGRGAGNLFIADTYNTRIRKVAAGTGIISTVAGTGEYGFRGDGRVATSTSLAFPYGVVVDGNGNLFIADTANHRIRKVSRRDYLYRGWRWLRHVRRGRERGHERFTLRSPWCWRWDAGGNLFIADTGNDRIRKVAGRDGDHLDGGRQWRLLP